MRAPRTRWILLCFLIFFAPCLAAKDPGTAPNKLKIMAIFGHNGKSHFDVFKPLLLALARRGHDLTVASHFPRSEKSIAAEPLPNYKDVSLFDEKLDIMVNVVDLTTTDDMVFKWIWNMHILRMMARTTCEVGLKNPELKKIVESGEKFDLVLTEGFNTNCFMPIIKKLDAPFVEISTHQLMSWAIDQLGSSYEASHKPAMFSGLDRPMNFIQRTWNVLSIWIMTTIYDTIFHWHDQYLGEKYYGPGVPDVKEISKNVSLMLLNTHYSLHGAQLFPPNIVEVGGMHLPSKPSPLPKDVKKFLDEASEGVLYFNLGSMVKMATISEEKLTAVLNVLGSIPRKVIWKWETDQVPLKSNNVLVKKWLPQFDILSHPNVKCYFGHGGLLGMTEGVYNGVPMVLMPLYGDQHQNSYAAKARGIAQVLNYSELNERTLRHALDEVFNNTRYRENAKKVSRAFRDRPASPLETAVWWVEYVARGDNPTFLKNEGASMPWYQRNLIDVGVFLAAVAALFLYATYRVAKHLLCKRNKAKGNRDQTASKKRD